eukprot:gnl/Trimastix_PCT/4959.p1 GENE.gnl/Trimastix_PCT/4959~~gnl/Trimastix_PCT/4959.p1  ORF type:complete len:311 (-),score=59.86 gnl/Trimastix_PCT/4959:119-937(-)
MPTHHAHTEAPNSIVLKEQPKPQYDNDPGEEMEEGEDINGSETHTQTPTHLHTHAHAHTQTHNVPKSLMTRHHGRSDSTCSEEVVVLNSSMDSVESTTHLHTTSQHTPTSNGHMTHNSGTTGSCSLEVIPPSPGMVTEDCLSAQPSPLRNTLEGKDTPTPPTRTQQHGLSPAPPSLVIPRLALGGVGLGVGVEAEIPVSRSHPTPYDAVEQPSMNMNTNMKIQPHVPSSEEEDSMRMSQGEDEVLSENESVEPSVSLHEEEEETMEEGGDSK